ncbi:MAG: hydantoin racemase [Lachnospiraceae bacterium]|nr:hydantoin racemase [Lachnospiraceae bacterium]
MKKRILFINPVGHDECDKEVFEYLQQYRDPDTEIVVESLPAGLPKMLEYSCYEALIAEPMLRRIKKADLEGYDACIIGCYFDPFLDTAKEICHHMVVTAPAEAGMHIAATIGDSFSVIVVRNKTIPEMREYVYKRGFGRYLASMRSLEIPVRELQADPEKTKNRMREKIRQALEEDMAEVILLGCTVEIGFFKELQEELGIPVIDANIAPLKYAEFLCSIRDCGAGWYTSKIGKYESPDDAELRAWGMRD